MSGYPPGSGYPYGAPPAQPHGSYGAPPAGPYGGYGAPPAGPYGGGPPSQPSAGPYGGYDAPPAGPYGGGHQPQPSAPYAPSAGGSFGGGPPSQPSAPYAQPAGGGKPPKMQQGGGYQPSAPAGQYGAGAPVPYGAGPFAALVPSVFPPGTDPSVVACFQAADHDGSGFIDDKELQLALSSYNQSFSLRTVHLLMYLFTSSNLRKIGPKEFISVFYSLQNWRAIFERFDRDRSGKIDASELRDALLNLGFAVSPTVLDLLVSKFDKSGGKNKGIEYDDFIECSLTVKGLTEKFKEKDAGFTGSATFSYESFMLTVLPFLIA